MSDGLKKLATAIQSMTWKEMDIFATELANHIPHLIKAEKLDPHGLASLINDFADVADEKFADREHIEGEGQP